MRVLSLLSAMLLIGLGSAEAADHYIRAGASGSGSDWTNAYPALPATLMRGDTYYIADGAYGGYQFDDAVSGVLVTTVKKATTMDHGTATGWDATYGDGQATFSGQISFTTSNWVFDGQVGGGPGSWTTGHGFKIVTTSIDPGVLIGNYGFSVSAGNITVSHFEVLGNLNTNGGGSQAQDGVAITNGSGAIAIRYFYLHELGRCPFFVGVNEFLAEYGYTGQYRGTTAQHSEIMSGFDLRGLMTFRYNIVTHSDGGSTGGLMLDTQNGGSADVYGNIFVRPSGDTWGGSNGLIGGWTGANGEEFRRVSIFNNTFVNIAGVTTLGSLPNISSANAAQNNLFYTVASPGGGSVWQTLSHNHFISTPTIGTVTSTSVGDPFVNAGALDFRLTAATPAGIPLAAPYNRDMFGNLRGADGVWDRGAIEFGVGDTTPPSRPTNLSVL